jgi:hypothetical protein
LQWSARWRLDCKMLSLALHVDRNAGGDFVLSGIRVQQLCRYGEPISEPHLASLSRQPEGVCDGPSGCARGWSRSVSPNRHSEKGEGHADGVGRSHSWSARCGSNFAPAVRHAA